VINATFSYIMYISFSSQRTTDHGQPTGKLYHLRLRVECTFLVYFIHKPNSSEADYINNHILNVFKYVFNIQLIIKL
jgi:hypothetical protein